MRSLRVIARERSTETELVAALAKAPFDGFPDQGSRVGPVERVDRHDAGRGRDVDLRQPLSADYVDADEQKPALPELRADSRADFLLPRRQFGFRALAADREIGADLTSARNAVDGARNLAVDEHDALVALADLRNEF